MTAFALDGPTPTRGQGYEALARATAGLEPPFAVIDVDALQANAQALVRRAAGKPVRLATKSVRCRGISNAVLATDGFSGILALTLAEAIWLAEDCDDVVVGYPTTDAVALRQLAGDEKLATRVTIMVDSAAQLDMVERIVGDKGHPIRVCIDLDASLEMLGGRLHLGPRRSPIHTADAAVVLARNVVRRKRFTLVGLMAYEGQTAGVGDNAPGPRARRLTVRAMQMASVIELARRRAAVVKAVRRVAPLEFVNGGGTGSIEQTVAEDAVTEVAAGSGLYCPTLFDTYRSFRPHPAAFYVLPVVRRPSPEFATVLGGGWVASGAVGADRLPTPSWPPGLELTALEGAGEAQTPLTGPGAAVLAIGDRVFFRHAKAGELCERVNELHLVKDGAIIGSLPTYRGEGKAFL